mmetsp:Transcript_13307/g.20263  ORF Transcript_13307/g.20263 Transcript_13307/m.20263 type:complete len:480 (-) Transcript_13307:157-1596(-)|eukprot:CAMPEP_0178923372 /NCGR_PEP_ID=MMETSP0786-20121207/16684_1 /TAXON_ID=186022 /ORGANISM="Thalassionema frauenfeldii, Strain CCMP 1798" /LENGTH=479 /DNA_ID=CAMNT_0020597863 /DNA_START=51 /DNA_END=1490 /DNA_ORIENTATION=+
MIDENTGVEWLPSVSIQDLCHLRSNLENEVVRGLFCVYGSWNKDLHHAESLLRKWNPLVGAGRKFVAGMVQVDESDDSMDAFCGDNGCTNSIGCNIPNELPSLLAVVQASSKNQSFISIVRDVPPKQITKPSSATLTALTYRNVKATFNSLILGVADTGKKRKISSPNSEKKSEHTECALRIFVAGDRANVGKTSICLGLLGTLLRNGYKASDLAYIKPATQDESQQLLQLYCQKKGICCKPIGPIVFYKGFTRAFLAGDTESSTEMLQRVSSDVATISRGKRVVIIDGVGYPAVGSICGTDNVAVAEASGYSTDQPLGVLLVGPSGVGHAVDSFNLNANYFESRGIPVMGVIFNKLPIDGYYSLDNCKEQVLSYFKDYRTNYMPFGFVPMSPELASDNPLDQVELFIDNFAQHVDIEAILQKARVVKESQTPSFFLNPTKKGRNEKHRKRTSHTSKEGRLSRHEIEEKAKAAGAQTRN